MRLTTVILIASLMQVSAATFGQRITINQRDISLKSVLKEIRKQSGYDFYYDGKIIPGNQQVSVAVTNATIEEALKSTFKGLDLMYEIDGKIVSIKKKKSSFLENLVSRFRAIDVRGKVVDDKGELLAGATVKVKGSGKSVTTNIKGEFYLQNVEEDATLVISFVGYRTKELSARSEMGNILLEVSTSGLDEVQVIAYGTTTQRLNTGNVGSVRAKDIEKQPINNPLLALQGRVPGVFIQQSTGLPGSGVKVRIQGENSLGNGNDPLYVIDGVPYSSQLLPGIAPELLGSSGDNTIMGSPFSFINPADIESIDVLKDADATAIYGSRAANGAILITTKKGKPGKTQVNLDIQNGWGNNVRNLELLNTQQYLEMRKEALKNDGIAKPGTGDYDLNGVWDTTRNIDWQKQLIGNTAQFRDLRGSVSGGNDNTQFLIGAGYHKETTVFPGNYADQKGSLNFNINHLSPNNKLRIQLSGSYLVDENQLPTVDLTYAAIRLSPMAPPVLTEQGDVNWMPGTSGNSTFSQNPLRYIETRYRNTTSNLIGNFLIGYQIAKDLEIKSSFGYTNLYSEELDLRPTSSFIPEERSRNPRRAQYGTNNIKNWIIEPQIAYKKEINKGILNILVGSTVQHNNSNGTQILGSGYNSDLVLENKSAATSTTVISSINSEYKYAAIFGRINYNWQNKYILNLTARRDGSSRFGDSNKWHTFGALGAAWIFSEEAFFKDNIKILSYGKLRASYGTTGNDQVGDYRYLSLYHNESYVNSYQGISSSFPERLTNTYLQWEETKKIQFGLDLGFINDRILISTNYFRNRSSNQLLSYDLPITTGFYNVDRNFPATVQNSGWEVSLNTTNITKRNFSWSSSINITVPKNKLLEFPNIEQTSYSSLYFVGKPIRLANALKYMGVNTETGLYQFLDKSGNLTSTPDILTDAYTSIQLDPYYYGGFQNTINYKGFQFDILFQFVKQNGQSYRFGPSRQGLFQAGLGNQPAEVLNHWKKSGDNTMYQKFSPGNSSVRNAYSAATNSDAVFSDASYIRLKNISLSWEMPADWTKKMSLTKCRIYANGQNLLTFTNYLGLDPETKNASSLPPLRVITLGIQATL